MGLGAGKSWLEMTGGSRQRIRPDWAKTLFTLVGLRVRETRREGRGPTRLDRAFPFCFVVRLPGACLRVFVRRSDDGGSLAGSSGRRFDCS